MRYTRLCYYVQYVLYNYLDLLFMYPGYSADNRCDIWRDVSGFVRNRKHFYMDIMQSYRSGSCESCSRETSSHAGCHTRRVRTNEMHRFPNNGRFGCHSIYCYARGQNRSKVCVNILIQSVSVDICCARYYLYELAMATECPNRCCRKKVGIFHSRALHILPMYLAYIATISQFLDVNIFAAGTSDF